MNLHIQPIGFVIKKELIKFLEIKTKKLFTKCTDLIKIEMSLKKIKAASGENKECEIRMVIPGNDLIGRTKARTFEEATLLTIEILQRRLQTRKNKRTTYNHHILHYQF